MDLKLDPSIIGSFNGEPMLVYNNEGPEERVLILAIEQNLLLLKRSPSWYTDATFKVAPNLFYQVRIIQDQGASR